MNCFLTRDTVVDCGAKAEADAKHKRETAAENFMAG
jgi:hypothetical protein